MNLFKLSSQAEWAVLGTEPSFHRLGCLAYYLWETYPWCWFWPGGSVPDWISRQNAQICLPLTSSKNRSARERTLLLPVNTSLWDVWSVGWKQMRVKIAVLFKRQIWLLGWQLLAKTWLKWLTLEFLKHLFEKLNPLKNEKQKTDVPQNDGYLGLGKIAGVLCSNMWVVGKVLIFTLQGGVKEGYHCVFTRKQHGCILY